MELQKRKYKKHQVSKMIDAYKAEYEKLIAELRARNKQLAEENYALIDELGKIKEKEKLIVTTLERAEKTSSKIVDKAQEKYALEVQFIKEFHQKWQTYFNQLKKKYPMQSTAVQAIEIQKQTEKLLKTNNAKKIVEKLNGLVSKSDEKFNPKQKINDYIVATSDNGFNLDEVLNPGNLELEDLCKELGLMEESE